MFVLTFRFTHAPKWSLDRSVDKVNFKHMGNGMRCDTLLPFLAHSRKTHFATAI
jgi:hypothetical protein